MNSVLGSLEVTLYVTPKLPKGAKNAVTVFVQNSNNNL